MRFTANQVLAFTLPLCAAVSWAPFAEGQINPTRKHAAAPDEAAQFFGQSKALTGKERLGPKWSDEQRIDNCNVPADKRGTKPRPDTCTNAPVK
jgi:hypothetical protein